MTVYDPAGSMLASWSARVPGNSAADLAVDEEGRVFVAYRDDLVTVRDAAGAAAPSPSTEPEPTACALLADKQASPRELALGDSTTVELAVVGRCPGDRPDVDAVLVIDIDDYDEDPWLPDDELSTLKRVAISIIGLTTTGSWRIGAVTGGRSPTRVADLSDGKADLVRHVLDVYQRDERHELANGILAAAGLLQEQARPEAIAAVVVLANSTTIAQAGLDEAIGALGTTGIHVFAIGVGPRPDSESLRRIAGSDARYYRNPSDVQVAEIVRGVEAAAAQTPGAQLLASAVVTDVVPSNMRYLAGSGRPIEPGFDPASRTLTWELQNVGAVGARVSYRLQPEAEGLWPTNDSAGALVVDALGFGRHLVFPVPQVRVLAPPVVPTPSSTPSPSASVTPSETASSPTRSPTPPETATPPPTDTETPAPTVTPTSEPPTSEPPPTDPPTSTAEVATATASPTPAPTRLYLPIGLRESCPPKDVYLDVVLVIDASTSMLESTTLGRSKIDVAKESTATFLAGLRLQPGVDRAAIVVFNQGAHVLQPLTSDRAALESALAGIRLEEQSRVDLGVDRATVVLVTEGLADRLHAMVVLSDGKANPASGDQAVAAASRARSEGITLYVVGLGPEMDERVLRAMAASEQRYFAAPDPDAIPAIYRDLVKHVACPPEVFWGKP